MRCIGPALSALIFCACACLLTACGDDSSSSASDDTGTTGDSTGDAGTGDTGGTATTGDDTGTTGETGEEIDSPADSLRVSYISADSYSGLGGENSTVTLGFYDELPSPISKTSEAFGACTVEIVDFVTQDFSLEAHGAGTVRIEGGAEPVKILSHDGTNYQHWTSEAALYKGGEVLTFSAEGAAIAPFQTALTAPAHITITEPVPILGQPLKAEPGQALKVAWEGVTAGKVRVRISGPQNLPKPQTVITCEFEPGGNEGTVSAEALAKVVEPGTGTLAVDSVSATALDVPGWGVVNISAGARGLRKAGTPYATTIQF